MRFRHELRYAAPIDDVRTMVQTAQFWERVAEGAGATPNALTVEDTPEGVRVVVDQDQPVGGVPAFAKKFVGDSARAIRTQTWSGDTSALVIDTPGKPTTMSGTATLTAEGPETVLAYDLEVRASVPLVGGKLEKVAAALTTEAFDKERAVGAAWLRGDHR